MFRIMDKVSDVGCCTRAIRPQHVGVGPGTGRVVSVGSGGVVGCRLLGGCPWVVIVKVGS